MDEFVRFLCPKCGKRLRAEARQAGRRAKCSCGQGVLVPSSTPPTPADEDPAPTPPRKRTQSVAEDLPEPGDEATESPARRTIRNPQDSDLPEPDDEIEESPSRRMWPWLAGAGGLLVAVLVGVVAWLAVGSNRQPQQEVATAPPASPNQEQRPQPPVVKPPVEPAPKQQPKVEPPKVEPPKVEPPKVEPPKVEPPKVDPVPLGTWSLAEFWVDGEDKPADQLKGLEIAVGDETMVFEFATTFLQQKYKLNTKANPKEIDLLFDSGKPMLGIYEIDATTLRICFGERTRPTAFAGEKGKTGSMEFYAKRDGPGAAPKRAELYPLRPGQKAEIEDIQFVETNQTHGSLKFKIRVRPGAEAVDLNGKHQLWFSIGSPADSTLAEVLEKQLKGVPGLLLDFTGPGYAAGPCKLLRRSPDDPNVWIGKALLGEVDFTGKTLKIPGTTHPITAVPMSWVLLEPKAQLGSNFAALVNFPDKKIEKAAGRKPE